MSDFYEANYVVKILNYTSHVISHVFLIELPKNIAVYQRYYEKYSFVINC